jgi:hypothetical protein
MKFGCNPCGKKWSHANGNTLYLLLEFANAFEEKKTTPTLYVSTANSSCPNWPVVSDVQVET